MYAVSASHIADILHFNDKGIYISKDRIKSHILDLIGTLTLLT